MVGDGPGMVIKFIGVYIHITRIPYYREDARSKWENPKPWYCLLVCSFAILGYWRFCTWCLVATNQLSWCLLPTHPPQKKEKNIERFLIGASRGEQSGGSGERERV